MLLSGKKVLLGITGSISAYKAADLCRLLIQAEASVRVIMTEASTSFISPLTLSVLSKNKVEVEFVNDDSTWNNHVELGLWADLLVVAPASATTMAKFVNGICDNLLSATYLSARCPVLIAPAMDHDMYLHQATAENISVLKGRNHIIVGPEDGELASGLPSQPGCLLGRMPCFPRYLLLNRMLAEQQATDHTDEHSGNQRPWHGFADGLLPVHFLFLS